MAVCRSERLLRLVEQPHILDGDDGLIGEGLQQGDLLVAEGMHSVRRSEITPMLRLAQQGDAQNCAMSQAARHFLAVRKFVAVGGKQVTHMHRLSVDERTPGSPVTVDRPFLQTDRYRTVMRAETQVITILKDYDGIISIAKLAGALDDRLENRRDVGRRGGDHAEDVAAPGLVSQRLREIARLRLTSSNSRAFSIAITA